MTGMSIEPQGALALPGQRVEMRVSMAVSEAAVSTDHAFIAERNPAFAKFNRLSAADGVVSAADLHAAWVAGARGIRLAPLH